MKVAIIGGGAAGFFSAIAVKENHPDSTVVIFEKTQSLLSKVKISGGGRCNVTNACSSVNELCKAYPRGEKKLKKIFQAFSNKDAMRWFESRGVHLTVQDDGCVFPVSQNSQSIIDCLLNEAKRLSVKININHGISEIIPDSYRLKLVFSDDKINPLTFDKVIVTTGGSPKRSGLDWLEKLGHRIEEPVPSLFTFNMPDEPVKQLMGIVVEKTLVGIQGTRITADGPLLITHWGMSGPAILKLSSYGARLLSEMGYNFKIRVNWVNEANNDVVMKELESFIEKHPGKQLAGLRPYSLPERLWLYLLDKCELPSGKKWSELGNKGLNKLTNILTNDIYSVRGKAAFKDEFVTCGGVSLQSVDLNTMQSKTQKNIYFAGEVLDIDAITGGFNFQAAWSTGFVAGKLGNTI